MQIKLIQSIVPTIAWYRFTVQSSDTAELSWKIFRWFVIHDLEWRLSLKRRLSIVIVMIYCVRIVAIGITRTIIHIVYWGHE